jgi:hypothetical protein
MTLHDRLYGYHALLAARQADKDLADADHSQVTRRIGEAVRYLEQFGGTTRSDLIRTFSQPAYDGAVVADRVRAIIEGV